MKKAIMLAAIMCLVGCVSVYNYREEQPILATFKSTHSPQETQECILASWQKEPLGTNVSGQKTGRFYSVLALGDNVDVYSDNDDVVVNYYSLRGPLDPWSGKSKRIKAIKSCL